MDESYRRKAFPKFIRMKNKKTPNDCFKSLGTFL